MPGRTIRSNFRKKAIPPLWMWMRSGFFVICGLFLVFIGQENYARIFFTFAFIQLVSLTLAIFFQEMATGIKRFLAKQKEQSGK